MVSADLLRFEFDVAQAVSNPGIATVADAQASLQTLIDPTGSKTKRTITESLEQSVNDASRRRQSAIAVIRALSVPELLLSRNSGDPSIRHIVHLIEQAAPDFVKYFELSDIRQNYEKILRIETIHRAVIGALAPLSSIRDTSGEFMGARTDILHALNKNITKAYLQPYDITKWAQIIQSFYNELDQLLSIRNHEFPIALDKLSQTARRHSLECEAEPTFLAREFLTPFFSAALSLCSALDEDAKARFVSTIRLKRAAEGLLEKRYPLHDPGRTLAISIPLTNGGPGPAMDVTAQIIVDDEDSVATNSKLYRFGNISPGDFAFVCEALILEPCRSFNILLSVEWSQVLSTTRSSLDVSIPVSAQATDIDWDTLAKTEPYSLEVAEGDEFVGRQQKLQSIAGRLMHPRMVSSYITGQKRIGKSSLALAVRDYVRDACEPGTVFFLLLDRGDYAHEDPRVTLKMLGDRIAEFLANEFPSSSSPGTYNFEGTLAPLNRLSDLLLQLASTKRFVIILDEFDGIHPELYRMGALAETFFSNLRTLSAKKNMAFLLVGGENMPFIIAAQGDELNKFVRESVTFFSRVHEWSDFCSLVEKPVGAKIRWYDSALNALFNWTNGHPYYTKLVCAEVFRSAIQDRDGEITAGEVEVGAARAIGYLDTNAFAHLWKDGIGGTREEAEVVSLRRIRVLIAVGRAMRAGATLSVDGISPFKGHSPITDLEIANTLQDFCNRGIMEEDGGRYDFTLPLFREWLKQTGVNIIMPDRAADDLAAELTRAADAAYVQDQEIVALATKWPAYNGQPITPPVIRFWIEQVQARAEQRLLFKLLTKIHFLSDLQVREALLAAHRSVARALPVVTRKHRSERRSDVIVTYIDGPAKSGAEYARRYAEQNLIASHCVLEMANFSDRLKFHEEKYNVNVHGVVMIDDLIGTGLSMTDNLQNFMQINRSAISLRNPVIRAVAVCATSEGQVRVREKMRSYDSVDIDLIVALPLGVEHFAFPRQDEIGLGIWESRDELDAARSLCRRLGSYIERNAPLGFGGQGLLLVFPQGCPNNTLPIIHHEGSAAFPWTPLFPRSKH